MSELMLYRIILKPQYGLATPLQADTIWGHLVSWMAMSDYDALEDFLGSYREGRPAVVFSDGMPALADGDNIVQQYLPVPDNFAGKFKDPDAVKQAKKLKWIAKGDLEGICSSEAGIDALKDISCNVKVVSERVVRMGNKVPRFGAKDPELHPLALTVLKLDGEQDGRIPVWTVLAGVAAEWEQKLKDPIDQFLRCGYGKKKNVGAGQFDRIKTEVLSGSGDVFAVKEPDAALMLSGFVPSPDDPRDGKWQVFTKYGRLGESAKIALKEYADAEKPNVFKSPITLIKPGAVFRLKEGEEIRGWYGTPNLKGVRHESEYIHPALTLAVPYRV